MLDDRHDYELLNHLWRGQVRPRIPTVFRLKIVTICVLMGLGATFIVFFVPRGSVSVQGLSEAGMSIGAVTFSGCLTVLVLTVGLPSEERIKRWARSDVRNGESNHFSELVFSVAWACLTQIILILVCLFSLVVGGDNDIAPHDPRITHIVILCLSCSWFFYSVWELITVLTTVIQVANVMAAEARSQD